MGEDDIDVLASVPRFSNQGKSIEKYIENKKKGSSQDNKSKQFKEDIEPEDLVQRESSLKAQISKTAKRKKPTSGSIESLLRQREATQNEKLREFKDDKNPFP